MTTGLEAIEKIDAWIRLHDAVRVYFEACGTEGPKRELTRLRNLVERAMFAADRARWPNGETSHPREPVV